MRHRAALQIGRALTRARLLGDPDDAPLVERRLQALMQGAVPERLAAQDGGGGGIICLPALDVRLRLTRAELEGGGAADLWAAAIRRAIAAADGAGQVWRFADAAALHAGYLRHRLGLRPAPEGVFAGFGTLDLLSPVRAMAEMLRSDPALWQVLGAGGDALPLVRAVAGQGGAAAAALILAEALRAEAGGAETGGVGTGQAALRAALARLAAADWGLPGLPARDIWAALPPDLQRLLATLVLAPLAPAAPVTLAFVTCALLALLRQRGTVSAGGLVQALRQSEIEAGRGAGIAAALAGLAAGAADDARLIAAALGRVAAELGPAAAHAPAPDADGTPADPDRADSPARPADARARDQARHYEAPFAGVALLLTHLAEDGIGAAFPAAARLAALAMLVQGDLFPAPETSPFLMALTGADARSDLPDRPGPRDLMFIAADRHATVMDAAPGAPRLAAWLLARFAATLPGLGASSRAFLQRQFLLSPGEVWIDRTRVTLRLDPVPLQPVLDMAGRVGADLARLGWLNGQRLTIRSQERAL